MTVFHADMHTHTTCSDGILSPEQLVEKASASGFGALAITDHDTVEAHRLLRKGGYNGSLRVIPALEVSCTEVNREVHVLGYWVRTESPELLAHEAALRADRERRALEIVSKLRTIRAPISIDEVRANAGTAPIGRPHIAQVLVKRGFVRDIQHAFDTYLDVGKPGYAPKSMFTVKQGVDMIHAAGGVAIVAHPGKAFADPRMFLTLLTTGIDGIEVYHPSHWSVKREYYRVLANQHELLISGGSDYHGTREYDEKNFGNFGISEELSDTILTRALRLRQLSGTL